MSFGVIPGVAQDLCAGSLVSRPAADMLGCRYCGSRLGLRDEQCRQCGAPSHLPAIPDRPVRVVIDEALK